MIAPGALDCADGGMWLSGRFKPGAPAPPTKTQFCSPCTKLHETQLQAVVLKHAAKVERLQSEVKRLKHVLDRGIEAKSLAERFLDREIELKQELDKTKQLLLKASTELVQTKYLVKNKHDMTEKCKRLVKTMEHKCAEYDVVKARIEELERSVMEVCVVSW